MPKNISKFKLLLAVLLILSSMAFAHAGYAAKKIDTEWGYKGNLAPEHWGNLSPGYKLCATGKEQSPINISNPELSQTAPLQVNYQSAPLRIVKDGTTTLHMNGHKLVINDGHTIQLNFPQSGPQESITFAGNYYCLLQLHFHFPSENQVNGQAYPAEIHFVHETIHGRLAVIGVFIKEGKRNPILDNIIAHLPKDKGKIHFFRNTDIAIQALLPKNKSYYSFPGSLTTPPCFEGVQWLVMTHPIEASPRQLQELAAAISERNARPVQPLENRKVLQVNSK